MAIFNSRREVTENAPARYKRHELLFIGGSLLILLIAGLLKNENIGGIIGRAIMPGAMSIFVFYATTYIPIAMVARTVYIIAFIGIIWIFYSR
jgi:hypothetical protein